MTKTVRAIYESGVLKPLEKLELTEHEEVQLTVETLISPNANGSSESPEDPLEGLRVSTGIADLSEHFDDYRFGRKSP